MLFLIRVSAKQGLCTEYEFLISELNKIFLDCDGNDIPSNNKSNNKSNNNNRTTSIKWQFVRIRRTGLSNLQR